MPQFLPECWRQRRQKMVRRKGRALRLEMMEPRLLLSADDMFEPNDTAAEVDAAPVGAEHSPNLGPLAGTRRIESLSFQDAADWFKFRVDDYATSHDSVRIEFSDAQGDLNLYVYRSDGTTQVGSSTGYGDNEQVSLAGQAPGEFYAVVRSRSGDTNPAYTLQIDPPGNSADDAYEANDTAAEVDQRPAGGVHSPNFGQLSATLQINGLALEDQADFYRFETLDYGTSHDSVSLAFDDDLGDLNLYVYKSDGTTLVDSSTGYGDNESVSLASQAPGVFYAKVVGRSGDANAVYSLKIDPPGNSADDAYEANDTAAEVDQRPAGGVNSPNFGRLSATLQVNGLALEDQADFYRFETLDYGTSHDGVSLAFDDDLGDLNLYVYRSDGTTLVGSSTGYGDGEAVSLAGQTPGVFYAKVVGRSGDANAAYSLKIDPPGNSADDAYEANNTAAEVDQRPAGGVNSPNFGRLSATLQVNGLALEDQADFYRFETLDYGTSHDGVSLAFDDDLGDLNLYVYRSDGTTLVGSSTGYGDGESVSLAGQTPGVFYAKVVGRSGDANAAYSLKIDPPGNSADDAYEANDSAAEVDQRPAGGVNSPNFGRLSASLQINGLALEDQADFYRFETLDYATSHDSVSLAFDDDLGDLNLYVYHADGTTSVGSSTGYGDSESVSLAGQGPGVFYAKVVGRSGDANAAYSLKIDPPGNTTDDPYEPNDTVEQVLEHTAGGSESPNLGRLVASTSLTRLALYDQADFYGFELADYGRTSDFVRLEFSHAAGNLDLYLYREGDTNALASATGWSDNETISLNDYPPGKYFLGVVGRNGAGNFNYQLTIAPPPAPPVRADLQVLSASGLVPRPWVAPGAAVSADWQVRNLGEVAAGSFDLTWYLSGDAVLDAADTPLATRRLSLGPGASEANANDSVTVPAGTAVGEYFLILAADPAGAVAEHCETNNWLAAPLTVSSAAAPQTVLRGVVVADQNANRFGDASEAGLAGVGVFVDTNRNGRRDPGEPTTTTDALGKYEFTQLPPGWWSVQLELSDRQQMTYPVVPAEPGIYVVDEDGVLGVVDPASGAVRVVGETGQAFYDIAFDPWGRLYGITSSSLYRIDPHTAAVGLVGGHAAWGANALTFDADGVLYACDAPWFGGSRLYRIDPQTAATTELANLGTLRSAGDLAFHQGKLYLTTASDQLVEIVLGATVSTWVVGSLGRRDVMGLVTGDDGVLYGLTHNVLLRINPATGVAETVSSFRGRGLGQSFGGAVGSEAFQPRQARRLTRTVASQPAAGVDFGVVTTSRLDGTLYHDGDRSATRTANEPPLAGWYVFVDTNRDGAWQARESRAQSTATGEFSFAGLAPGVHRLQFLPADGWALTTSAHSYLDVTVSSSVPSVSVEVGADRADPPRIVALWPEPDSEVQATVAAIDIDFNQPMEPATLWPGSFELLASGGDGGFYEGQERRIPIGRVDWDPALNRATLQLAGPLSRDHYLLRVRDQMIDGLGTRLDGEWRGRFPTGDSVPGGDSLFRFFVVNSPPTVVDQRGSSLQGVAQPIQLEATDPEGDALTFSLLAGPAHGQLTQTPPDGQWSYTADSNYSGTDQFRFRVTDVHGAASEALYELRVTPSPADLEPLALTVSAGGVTPGLPFRVAWTVANRGPGATASYYGEDWTDEVYLSSDATLDASDRRLLRWPTEAGVVLAGQQITVAPETELVLDESLTADGSVYLLVRVNANGYQRETNGQNNVLAQLVPLRPGVQLTSPTAGQFVATGGFLDLQWRDFDPQRSAVLTLAIDLDGDPSNGQGETVLASGLAEDDPLNRTTVRVPSLNPGTYYVFARMEDVQGVYYSTPVAVRVVEEVFASDEPLGDALGGSGYEVFDILAGRVGDEVQFQVRTNFDPRQRGGDLYLNVGGSYDRNTGRLAGIAANTRTTLSGAPVTAGALYVGATFQQGTARSAHPTFIRDFQTEIVGRSAFRVATSSNTPWRFEITGSFFLSDLGAGPGDALQIGWAMYCGNDFAHAENDVTLPDLAGDGFAVPRDAASRVDWGDAITVSYATINQGTADAAVTQARVVLSRDTQFTGGDVLLATLEIPALDVNQRVEATAEISLPGAPPAGFSAQDRVYIGVIQDFGDAVHEGDELNNAGLGEGIDWASLSIGGPPRFVNVLTHGFNPTFWDFDGFRSNWLGPFNAAVEDLARDQGFAGNSVNYVTQWDSSSGWIDAMLSTVAYFLLRHDPRTQWLAPLALARVGPAMDRAERLAYAAGDMIVDDLLGLPDYLGEPADGQEIHLIGHSRGGAVSAYASALLADRGYTVAQATMLDGYSTDWPNLSGILGDISIVDLTAADRKVNYRVEAGLAEALGAYLADTIHQYLPWLPRPDVLQSLGRLPDWRAPVRAAAGFDDELLAAYPPYARSDHLNVSELYFFSDRNMPPETAYLRNSPLGRAAAGASGAAPPAALAGGEDGDSPLLESAGQTFANFNDGSLDELGDIWRQTEALAADLTLDDPFLDAWLQIARQPASLLESVWTAQGDVRLGVDATDAWLELTQLDQDAAVGQYLIIGDTADALRFDLSILSAGPDDRLVVTLDSEPIYSVSLTDAGAAGLKEVPLESFRGRSGQLTFTLTGPLSLPASLQLDDLRVVANLSLDALTASPVQPTTADPNVQLTATGLYDPQGIATGVAFYVESNGILGLQTGAGGDRRLGLDANGTDGWTLSWNTASETGGVLTVYAQAESDQPVAGGVAAVQVLIEDNPTPWHNSLLPVDVNGNGDVEPLDVLLVINYINAHLGSSSLPPAPASPPPYYDVNGDGFVTAADVLMVINYINSMTSGAVSAAASTFGLGVASAEGEAPHAAEQPATADASGDDALLPLASLGVESESRRGARRSPILGRLEPPSVPGPCAARGPLSLNPSGTQAAARLRSSVTTVPLRRPAWLPAESADTATEWWWTEIEQALSLMASDVAAVMERR